MQHQLVLNLLSVVNDLESYAGALLQPRSVADWQDTQAAADLRLRDLSHLCNKLRALPWPAGVQHLDESDFRATLADVEDDCKRMIEDTGSEARICPALGASDEQRQSYNEANQRAYRLLLNYKERVHLSRNRLWQLKSDLEFLPVETAGGADSAQDGARQPEGTGARAGAVDNAIPPAPGQAGGAERSVTQNPYERLAQILHDLCWLAAEVRQHPEWSSSNKAPPTVHRINPLTAPWDPAEQTARSTSIQRGIPFNAFDPVLIQAREILHELIQVAAGNMGYRFSFLDPKYSSIERRLKDLGATYAGAPPGGSADQAGTGRPEGARVSGTPPAPETPEGTDTDQEQRRPTPGKGSAAGKLAPSRAKAMSQYLDALSKCPTLEGETDQTVYTWLKEHSDGDALQSFAVWSRYVREARRAAGTSKNTPRSGRKGRSIVRPDEI